MVSVENIAKSVCRDAKSKMRKGRMPEGMRLLVR